MRDRSPPFGDGQGHNAAPVPRSHCRIQYSYHPTSGADARDVELSLGLPYVRDHIVQCAYAPELDRSWSLRSLVYEVQSVRASGVLHWSLTLQRDSIGASSLSLMWCDSFGGLVGGWTGRVVQAQTLEDGAELDAVPLPSSAPAELVELVSFWAPALLSGGAVVCGPVAGSPLDAGAS